MPQVNQWFINARRRLVPTLQQFAESNATVLKTEKTNNQTKDNNTGEIGHTSEPQFELDWNMFTQEDFLEALLQDIQDIESTLEYNLNAF